MKQVRRVRSRKQEYDRRAAKNQHQADCCQTGSRYKVNYAREAQALVVVEQAACQRRSCREGRQDVQVLFTSRDRKEQNYYSDPDCEKQRQRLPRRPRRP